MQFLKKTSDASMMDKAQKHVGPKQTDTEYMLFKDMKFKDRLNQTTMIEIRTLFAFGLGVTAKKQE